MLITIEQVPWYLWLLFAYGIIAVEKFLLAYIITKVRNARTRHRNKL